MRHYRIRLALAAIASSAAVVVGTVAFAGTSSAQVAASEDGLSVEATAITTAAPGPVTGTPVSSYESTSSDDKWEGGAVRDVDAGTWRAAVTRGDETVLLGHFAKQKDAEAAGKREARKRNKESGVMDGPGCDPPLIVC